MDLKAKVLSVCLGLGLMGLPALAQSQRLSVLAQAGGAFHEENNLRPGVETGFGASYPLETRFSVSLEYLHWTSTSKEFRNKLYDGTLTLSPILLSVQYNFHRNEFFFPYAFVGGGYMFTRFKIGKYISIPEIRINQRVDGGPAFYFGLGARIAFSESWSFVAEAAYLMRNATGETIISDMNLGVSKEKLGVNLHVVFLKFGLRFYL